MKYVEKEIHGKIREVGRHPNGGGLVEKTAHVEKTVYVGLGALVLDQALVVGEVRLLHRSKVCGSAIVKGNVKISGNAEVCANAIVQDNAQIHGYSKIGGNAKVNGDSKISGFVVIAGETTIGWGAEISSACREVKIGIH